MKKYICALGLFLIAQSLYAQNSRQDVFYTMSGIGFSFPAGESRDYLAPKFSSTLGANIGLGRSGGWFIYPKVNLHTFGFDQLVPEPGNAYLVKDGRASTYLLNANLGYRGSSGNLSYYAFAGGGGGFILTQRAAVSTPGGTVTLSNENTGMGTAEAGAGLEYRLGTFILFVEGSYLRGFSELENRSFSVIPLSGGFKTDLSKLFRKK